jgi:multidrug efflux pump subunit AcrA (membrane-fusion protein)
VPLVLGVECIAVVTLERDSGDGFDAADRAWLDTLAALLPAVIDQKRAAERGYGARLRADGRKLLERLFGPRHLVWKFGATAALLAVLVLAFTDVEYRVAAKTVVEGQAQRAAVAPFDSFVTASMVRAGDTVRQGQVLCRLDERELRLEENKWRSEREQYSSKLREAMANHELAAIQVLGAQLQQAEAQLALVTDRLGRVDIRAPFDGVIISGDLSQLVGSPVETGKKLFEIAPLHAYRVILQVDERDMRHLKVGQRGKLMISGVVGEPIELGVSKITPVATAQDGRNFFRVEAALAQAPAHLRPGMEGIGKVNAGPHSLWWILTHSFTDWLRLSVWTWLP